VDKARSNTNQQGGFCVSLNEIATPVALIPFLRDLI